MIVRLLKGYTLNTGKTLPMGTVFRRHPKEAARMINEGIAEGYTGVYPPKKMKTNLFKPKWQQQE